MASTVCGVNAREATSRIERRTSSTCVGLKESKTKPIEPASANSRGGSESSAKNAASAASPVTRFWKQVATVDLTSRQATCRVACHRVGEGEPGLFAFADMALP